MGSCYALLKIAVHVLLFFSPPFLKYKSISLYLMIDAYKRKKECAFHYTSIFYSLSRLLFLFAINPATFFFPIFHAFVFVACIFNRTQNLIWFIHIHIHVTIKLITKFSYILANTRRRSKSMIIAVSKTGFCRKLMCGPHFLTVTKVVN